MQKRCTECYQDHDAETMVQFGDDWVCNSCKSVYAHKLEAGLVGDGQGNQCPYCGETWSISMKQYFHEMGMGEHLCDGCEKLSRIEMPRWLGKIKAIVFVLTAGLFFTVAAMLSTRIEPMIARAAIFLVAIVAFIPSVLILQYALHRAIFVRFMRLTSVGDIMDKAIVPAHPKIVQNDGDATNRGVNEPTPGDPKKKSL